MTITGSRKHPDEFVGLSVVAYPTCGPGRLRRQIVYVAKYDPENGMAYLQTQDGTELMVPNADWTVENEVAG